MAKKEVRKQGYDVFKIVQTGHVFHVEVKPIEGKDSANVIIGVRSSVGNRYDADYDDHNEVSVFWTRYFKDADAAEQFAENCEKGKYVTVIGSRRDYNVKDKKGNWNTEYENYNVETIQWGVDFSEKED